MQLKELNSQGYEVVLVTSGAVGLGRQRLRYRKLVNSRFQFLHHPFFYLFFFIEFEIKKYLIFVLYSLADLQNPQVELDGKACAAVGQNSLMALYDTLFSQVKPETTT